MAPATERQQDRRRSKRIPLRGASMACRGDRGDLLNISTLFDISEGGVGFCTRDKVDIGTKIKFDFYLPISRKGEDINGEGKVVWIVQYCDVFGDNVMRCGLQFLNLPSRSQQGIRKYIKITLKQKKNGI